MKHCYWICKCVFNDIWDQRVPYCFEDLEFVNMRRQNSESVEKWQTMQVTSSSPDKLGTNEGQNWDILDFYNWSANGCMRNMHANHLLKLRWNLWEQKPWKFCGRCQWYEFNDDGKGEEVLRKELHRRSILLPPSEQRLVSEALLGKQFPKCGTNIRDYLRNTESVKIFKLFGAEVAQLRSCSNIIPTRKIVYFLR